MSCFNFTSRVFNSPTGWCSKRQLVFFLHPRKTPRANKFAVHRLTCSVGLTYCLATHMIQTIFLETDASAKDFITTMKEKVAERNHHDILNMYQTPIPYSYHLNKTLDVIGAKTIHTRASTTYTKHVTLAVTVTASGKMLPPFLIFTGMQNGCIAMRESQFK